MMISFKQLTHFSIHTTDDRIGGCRDVLFDDQDFVARYLVADTNTWLPLSRKVVISPISVESIDMDDQQINVAMTAEVLKNSPSIDEHKPVSREYEETLFQYFGYGYYWIGPGAWGDFAHPGQLADLPHYEEQDAQTTPAETNHLRACSEVNGYDVATLDDTVGHICDFVIDTTSWAIVLLVVDTNNWLPGGKKLAVPPIKMEKIDWSNHSVSIAFSHDALMQQPEVDSHKLADEDYVKALVTKASA
ncbi:PRC-barrel domain-containing protein [Alteromonas sp. CYL-A6]|uniref:PRC-barrel domain-containing protein n=1 Tax=Alteromonas nitratireducens TaxID=3390813 RepID=UPI0034B03E03